MVCLASNDFKMSELVSNDPVIGSVLCLWSPNFCIAWFLELELDAVLICLDSLKFPSCTQTTHMGLCIYTFKVVKEMISFNFA